jgi:two-component system chemotaxis sensor kinase CheA
MLTELLRFDQAMIDFTQLPSIEEPLPYVEVEYARESESGRAQVTIQRDWIEQELRWIVFFRDVTLEEKLQKKYRSELQQKENFILELQKAQTELENYSRNLEKMVDQRTFEIKQLSATIAAMLDSLTQGFFMFDKEGVCSPVFSKACLDLLEVSPSNQPFSKVINLESSKEEGIKKWIDTLFMDLLPFEDVALLGPKNLNHPKNKHIQLDYHPLRNQGGIEKVVVVATDVTPLIHAQQQSELERAKSKSVLQMVQFKKQAMQFLNEAEEMLKSLQRQLSLGSSLDKSETFVLLHTLKGGAATFAAIDLVESCHQAENFLALWSTNKDTESFLKLSNACAIVQKTFHGFVHESEIILGDESKRKSKWIEVAAHELESFLKKNATPLAVKKFNEEFLSEPLGSLFAHFNEAVQQIALQSGKKIKPLVFNGSDLKVDPQPLQGLIASLVHCYKNAADHGIEMPAARWEHGKSEEGSIVTNFSKSKDVLNIEIIDDGSGVDPTLIRKKLAEKQIPHEHWTDDEVIYAIFREEFSTKLSASTISGRGVGLSAVQNEVQKLKGQLLIQSVLGKGLKIQIQLPIKAAKISKVA